MGEGGLKSRVYVEGRPYKVQAAPEVRELCIEELRIVARPNLKGTLQSPQKSV